MTQQWNVVPALLLAVFAIAPNAAANEEIRITRDQTEYGGYDEVAGERQIHQVGSDTPFTGMVVGQLYPDGSPGKEIDYENGLLHGIWTSWHPNGQKRSESNWSNGWAQRKSHWTA